MTEDAGPGGTALVDLGRRFREARERRKWSLDQVSERTRINVRVLAALEAGDLSRMPAPVYARGFVRTYARALDLAEEELLRLLDTAGIHAPTSFTLPPLPPLRAAVFAPPPAEGARRGRAGAGAEREASANTTENRWFAPAGGPSPRTMVTAVAVVSACVLLGLAVRGVVRLLRVQEDRVVPPSPFQQAGPPARGAGPQAVRPSLAAGIRVTATAIAACEIQYQPDGKRARWMTLQPGQSTHFSAREELRLLIGNPAGLDLAWGAGPIDLGRGKGRAAYLRLTGAGVERLPLPAPAIGASALIP